MERRQFLQRISKLGGGLLVSPAFPAWKPSNKWHRALATNVVAPNVTFPVEKRIPLGWKAFPVSKSKETLLQFTAIENIKSKAWLRITAAIDFRERKK